MRSIGMIRIHRFVKFVRRAAKQRLVSGSQIERDIYYAVVDDSFRREWRAVARGQATYYEHLGQSRSRFLIRRNVHMLEKGLVMRPRRGTFALDYIDETVDTVCAAVLGSPPLLSVAEADWALDVLDQYFDATAKTNSDVIAKAHERFVEGVVSLGGRQTGLSGPARVCHGTPPVAIEALLELARRRKSVRWYLPETVPRDVVDNAVRVGAESPSACNRQPFELRIYDEPEIVRRVAEIPMGTKGYATNIPSIAVVVGDLSAFVGERDRHLIYVDGCLAAMGFILGLEAQGVSSCCINWPDIKVKEQAMQELLDLRPYERPVMLIAFGYADPTGHAPHSARRDLGALRSYNKR